MVSNFNTRANKKEKYQQRCCMGRICLLTVLIVIVLTFSTTVVMIAFLLPGKSILAEENDISGANPELFLSDLPKSSSNYIYIDIGCFNGETVEHFLHFVPNSTRYDIITFEPDPLNYYLCKQRLTQKKYANVNITILQKVVWIRNEKVSFQTDHGRLSRIQTNITVNNDDIKQLDAIDFSSWLAHLAKPNKTKIYIKISAPGAEVPILEKMVLDETLELAEKYEVEWSDREDSRIRATRIYLQMMFENRGFDCLYYIRLQDARRVMKLKRTFQNVTKHYDWRVISTSDTYAHFQQRPDMFELPRKLHKPNRL